MGSVRCDGTLGAETLRSPHPRQLTPPLRVQPSLAPPRVQWHGDSSWHPDMRQYWVTITDTSHADLNWEPGLWNGYWKVLLCDQDLLTDWNTFCKNLGNFCLTFKSFTINTFPNIFFALFLVQLCRFLCQLLASINWSSATMKFYES